MPEAIANIGTLTHTAEPSTASTVRPRRAASGAWLHLLSPEKRRALSELHTIDPGWNWVALAYPLIWLAGGLLVYYVPIWPVRIFGYIAIGAAIHAMAVLVHEASHLSMFRNALIDRVVGVLMGIPVFVSYTAYKVLHADHHKHTRGYEDPDEFLNVSSSKLVQSILFYAWFFIGTPVYLVHVAIIGMVRGNWRSRFDIMTEYVFLAGIGAGAYILARRFERVDLVIHCWAIPMIVAMVFANVRSWAEHAMTVPGSALTRTRTVTSNKVVSFMMCNLNYHLEHHLCPGIPWYKLPRMHVLLQDDYKKHNAIIYKSYLHFLWDALRNGVHGLAMPSM